MPSAPMASSLSASCTTLNSGVISKDADEDVDETSSSLNPTFEIIFTMDRMSSAGWPCSSSHEETASAPAFASPLYFQSRTSWSNAASSTVSMEDSGRDSSLARERAVARTLAMCHQSCEPSWPASSDLTHSSASATMDAVMMTREVGRGRRSRTIGKGRVEDSRPT